MTGSGSHSGDIFDVKRIRRLVELMNEHELSEVDLKQGDQRIRLRKGMEPVVTVPTAKPTAPSEQSAATPIASGEKPAGGTAKVEDERASYIKSPMVGTFYAAASPDAPPFVKVGDHVGPTTTVCVIEAMKVFNEIPAEVSGQIVSVLVENGEPVEFGQPLFKVIDMRG
jgi:acetyl-CoA carboxylase biotin carboxyl carrier protein